MVTEVLVQRICRTGLLGVSFPYQEVITIYGDTKRNIPNGSDEERTNCTGLSKKMDGI